jgi:hypothetical protein
MRGERIYGWATVLLTLAAAGLLILTAWAQRNGAP